MVEKETIRADIACLGHAPLAASMVLMSALVAEMVLATVVDIPLRAGLALVTSLTLASAVLGLLCMGRCVLRPALSTSLGVILLVVRAWWVADLTGLGGDLATCVLTLFAAGLLGAALGRGLELSRRTWTLALAACAIQIALYSIPPLGGAIRSGALARFAFVVPVPEESALAGPAAAGTSAFGLDLMEAVFLAALMWRAAGGPTGTSRAVAAVVASAIAAALVTMGLGFRPPMLPLLVASFYIVEIAPVTTLRGTASDGARAETGADAGSP